MISNNHRYAIVYKGAPHGEDEGGEVLATFETVREAFAACSPGSGCRPVDLDSKFGAAMLPDGSVDDEFCSNVDTYRERLL